LDDVKRSHSYVKVTPYRREIAELFEDPLVVEACVGTATKKDCVADKRVFC